MSAVETPEQVGQKQPLEKEWPKSLLSRLVGGVLPVSLGRFLAMVLALLTTMLVARHLSSEDFGTFILIGVIAAFLTQISSFGMDLTAAKLIASTDNDVYKGQFINAVITFRLFTIVLVSIVSLIAREAISALFGASLTPGLAVFIPSLFLLVSLRALLQSILQGFGLFWRLGLGDFLSSLLNLILVVVVVVVMKQGVLGLIFATLISELLWNSFLFFSIPTKKRLEWRPELLKGALKFGFPLQINDILTLVFQRIDSLLIGALLGPAEIAYYAVARKIPEGLGSIFQGFISVYFPFMSKLHAHGEHKKVAQLINNTARVVSFAGISVTLIVLLFGSDLIRVLFSEKYLPSVNAFVLLMLTLSISFVSNIFGTSLVAAGGSKEPAIINSAHVVTSLVCNFVFIPQFGIIGAALAGLVGNLVSNPLNVLFLRRRMVEIRVKNYLKPFLIFGLCGILFLLFNPIHSAQKALIIGSFVLACAFLSVFTVKDLTFVSAELNATITKLLRSSRSESAEI